MRTSHTRRAIKVRNLGSEAGVKNEALQWHPVRPHVMGSGTDGCHRRRCKQHELVTQETVHTS